jgi:hypothetical protein
MGIAVFDYRVCAPTRSAAATEPCSRRSVTTTTSRCSPSSSTIPARIASTGSGSRHVPRRCCSWPTSWSHRSATYSSSDGEGNPTIWSGWSRAAGVRRPVVRPFLLRRVPAEGDREAQDRARQASLARPSPPLHGRIRRIVVPSHGLARKLLEEYPTTAAKADVIPNASASTGCGGRRASAAGRYAPASASTTPISPSSSPRSGTSSAAVAGQVAFVGMQDDVRPFVWAGDIFALPSAYEVVPLAALEAGAAALPLLATELDGLRDLLADGRPATSCIAPASAWRPACGGSAACLEAKGSRLDEDA